MLWLVNMVRNFWEEDTDPDIETAMVIDPGQLTQHFHVNEWRCKDKDKTMPPREWWPRLRALAENLETLRAELGGRPIKIMSGYRTIPYNVKVGGAVHSQHIYCRAADIKVPGVRPEKVAQTIEGLIKTGGMKDGGLGVYPRGFRGGWCHYDTRKKPARWQG